MRLGRYTKAGPLWLGVRFGELTNQAALVGARLGGIPKRARLAYPPYHQSGPALVHTTKADCALVCLPTIPPKRSPPWCDVPLLYVQLETHLCSMSFLKDIMTTLHSMLIFSTLLAKDQSCHGLSFSIVMNFVRLSRNSKSDY